MIRTVSIFTAFLTVIALFAATAFLNTPSVQAGPLFRIIDVRAEYGQLVVEAQHYNPDGSHWFYELYTFQGREQFKRPRVVDAQGRLFLKRDGRAAPKRLNAEGRQEHYLPAGREWLRHNRPHLDRGSILGVIRSIHQSRSEDGWTKGQSRLTIHPLDASSDDNRGARFLKQRFRGLREQAYQIGSDDTLMAYAGYLAPIDPYISSAWGTVSTFYPDSHPESSSVDGHVTRTGVTEAWSLVQGGSGNGFSDTAATMTIRIRTWAVTNQWTAIARGVVLFDTSALGDGDIIDAATLGFVVPSGASYQDYFSQSLSLVTAAPASDTALVTGDYANFGTTLQAPDISLGSITRDDATYNTYTLNATGEGNISLTGVSKFGLRISGDNTDTEPSWASGMNASQVDPATSSEVLPGDRRPKLTVTHTSPSAAITGTIGDGATEQEVRDGGGTIIITLTDATWVTAGGTFDAQRQNIIDGLDSAESETHGWNNEVRDKIGVASVVRTSATIATVTLTASEVADYRIDSAETITATVPASAMSISGPLTAAPTIAIIAAAESVTVGGTLGASGGTPSEIVAGGETITLTLSNVSWVADGATFDAQRQNIIDGLDSNLSDQNGWDNRRADFAVTDVARTSDTLVTITLSASSAYAIPATETITAVVPASALVFGAALTGAPTFDIVPIFALSGNRVTSPIDLSSITDVAYCAIGWQATTPTNTTVTVRSSIDGGATYSDAENGSCPSGITVGGSLSSVTDFRVQVRLATTDQTVTPLVEGLGLLVQDTSGPALYYRLNTVPGVTITDRSANDNTGTMSYPTSQAGINSTTGVLESTRSTLSLEQLLSVGDIVSPVTGAAASGNIFNQTETGFGSLPFQDLMQTMATGGELPLKFVWVVAIGLFSIALGVVALHMTGSLMISGIGLGAGLSIGAAIGGGLIPGWTVILFVILALALVVMRSRGALPL